MASGSMENWGAPGPGPLPVTPLPTTKEEALRAFIAGRGDPSQTVMLINMTFGSIYPGSHKQLIKTGASDGWFRTKAEFTATILAEEDRRDAVIVEEVGVPAAEAGIVSSAPAISVNSRSSATGGGAGANNGIRITNPPEPELSLAIIPYVPTPRPPRIEDRMAALENPIEFTKYPSKANILMAIVIDSLKLPLDIGKGSWYIISAIISMLGEQQLPSNTLLGLIRSGNITNNAQLKYRHELLTKISKQIVAVRRDASPALINAASDAFTAGQEALLAAFEMFSALQTVRKMYPTIERTIAPGLQIKKAGLDSAECNLLKTYILFVKAIIDKYEKRRIFANEWLTLDGQLRKAIAADADSKSFIAQLFSRFNFFGPTSAPSENYNMGGASQTEYYGAANVSHRSSSGKIEALITENEMRMINALVVSILSNDAICSPSNLKAEIKALLDMKEADVPNIRNVARFNALYDAIVNERTHGTSGGGAAAAAFGGPIFGGEQGGPRTNFGSLFDKLPTNMRTRGEQIGSFAALPVTAARSAGQRIGAAAEGVRYGIGEFSEGVVKGVEPLTAAVGTAAGAIRTAAGGVGPALRKFGGSVRLPTAKSAARPSANGGTNHRAKVAAALRRAQRAEQVARHRREGSAGVIGEAGEEGDMIISGAAGAAEEDEAMPGDGAAQLGGYRQTRRAKHKKTRKAKHVYRNRKTRVQRKRLTRRR